jgi:preprotein translocase subunit SecD
MMIKFARFNIYLCCAVGVLFLTGCQTAEKKKAKEKDKEATTLELHMEVNTDGTSDNAPVSIGREGLFQVNVDQTPFVDSANLTEAKVVEEAGGFVIECKFDWTGSTLLESMTSANLGKRIAVFCKFGKDRWLAAPIIKKRITTGVFRFTPDATREEADRIVRGLNNVTKKLKKDDTL